MSRRRAIGLGLKLVQVLELLHRFYFAFKNRLSRWLIERYRKVLVPQKPFVIKFAEALSKPGF